MPPTIRRSPDPADFATPHVPGGSQDAAGGDKTDPDRTGGGLAGTTSLGAGGNTPSPADAGAGGGRPTVEGDAAVGGAGGRRGQLRANDETARGPQE